MFQRKNAFRLAASTAILASAFAVANTASAKNLSFSATINTMEAMVSSDLCSTTVGGVGGGMGTSNLFAKNPGKDTAPIMLVSSDCVAPSSADIPPASLTFFQGGFVLTGVAGDSLTATYGGTLKPATDQSAATPGTIVYSFESPASFTIVGGTGRYAKAKGSGQITGIEIVNFGNGTSQGRLSATGSIVY